MCGIFGVVAGESAGLNEGLAERILRRLYVLSQSRGTEAAGLALDLDDRIEVVKAALATPAFVRDDAYVNAVRRAAGCRPFAAIGHSRLVTNGTQERHENNQPVITPELVGIHNGIIVNDARLWEKFPALTRRYEVDSEVAFSLLGHFCKTEASFARAVARTYEELEGQASIAGFFRARRALVLATNNGSLYILHSAGKPVTIFASERQILERLAASEHLSGLLGAYEIAQLRPGHAALIDLASARPQFFEMESPAADISLPPESAARRVEDVLAERNPPPPVVDAAADEAVLARVRTRFGHDTTFADSLRRCTKCILPETMPFIEFDARDGVCNYCRNYQKITLHGEAALRDMADRIRRTDGRPDCVVGLSGGRDSCYGLHYLKKELGLNPVAYTYDWGMVTDLARRNISRMCGKLGVEHILISANIARKRRYIRKNVEAWLRKPSLGMIPLFMAGDKAYFYHANRLKRELGVETIFLCENMLERTDFKTGFAGVRPKNIESEYAHNLSPFSKLRILRYYFMQYATNPAYLNESLPDTVLAYAFYYLITREYHNLYKFIPWNEETIISTLRGQYDWELAPDTNSTWRIGDGTASFYNFIYYRIAGFTENDTFRSNQIREGIISREEALRLSRECNQPRFESMKWYCDTNGIDFERALEIITSTPQLPRPRGSHARLSPSAIASPVVSESRS